jgi:type IV pilus assembly protein PilQ
MANTWLQSGARTLVFAASIVALLFALTTVGSAQSQEPKTGGMLSDALHIDERLIERVFSVLLQPADERGQGRSNGAVRFSSAETEWTEWSAGPSSDGNTVAVHESGRVDLHVSDLPVQIVLRMIAEQTRTNIVTTRGVGGIVSADLYDVTLEEALTAILTSNGLAFRRDGRFIYVYTAEELAAIQANERRLETRVFHLRYITAKDAETIVKPISSRQAKMATTPAAAEGLGSSNAGGGAAGGQGTGGDSHANREMLIVVDDPERLAEIARVIAKIDVPPRQVLVEATILRAQLNEDNALGIDFTTVGGIDFAELNSVSPGVQSITTGLVPQEKLQETTFTVRTDFADNVPSGGFTFGIIKDQISAFIRALEEITDVSVLANPKILALNKQKGEVIVGRRDGFLTTTVTETTAIQSVEFLETGTRLIFRPFVLDDEVIRMEIHPEDSTGGLTAANLPFKQTTEVTTNILVKNGHTILIGGLFREVATATRGQVPILGNIPLAGALFRNTSNALRREEIIILLTVHIVEGKIEEALGDELAQDVERLRVGQRRSAHWSGRERLSMAHYRWAVEHFQSGNLSRAMWDANLALRTNPHNVQAMKLRERVLRRRDWDEDASSVRDVVQQMIEKKEGVEKPSYGRPAPPFQLPPEFEGPAGFEEPSESDRSWLEENP